MSNKILVIVLILIIAGLTYYFGFQQEPESQFPNSASIYCEEQGGTSDVRTFEGGQKGFCVFDDDSECEQWEFFQGECEKSESFCKDLCGDGVCQEIVCMAAGCPCAELPETCPQDCQNPKDSGITVTNFDECVAAGYPVMESWPRQCKTPDGKNFVEDIGDELEKTDIIRVNEPRPNELIQSPLRIEGEARGYWFFEGDFPVRLFDADGNELAVAIARTSEEWMTEDFVSFEAILEFESPATEKGNLILQKDNPSGLPENDDELRVPVRFPH